jgi:hypothetical protein
MKKQRLTLISLTVLLLFVTALLGLACEPGGEPIIENQRNEDLTIYVITLHENGVPPGQVRDYGVVAAQTTKQLASITFVKRSWVYRIEAVAPSGNVVFSHDYTMDDLEKIKWEITIPP